MSNYVDWNRKAQVLISDITERDGPAGGEGNVEGLVQCLVHANEHQMNVDSRFQSQCKLERQRARRGGGPAERSKGAGAASGLVSSNQGVSVVGTEAKETPESNIICLRLGDGVIIWPMAAITPATWSSMVGARHQRQADTGTAKVVAPQGARAGTDRGVRDRLRRCNQRIGALIEEPHGPRCRAGMGETWDRANGGTASAADGRRAGQRPWCSPSGRVWGSDRDDEVCHDCCLGVAVAWPCDVTGQSEVDRPWWGARQTELHASAVTNGSSPAP
ncbi:hypothetical protein GGR56DRAFT_163633 [Xylariaceae sp. FL0804]|nr:hypothetical protein GGR56DRAFT_163633 [Xylariaceae sp. FL0804]